MVEEVNTSAVPGEAAAQTGTGSDAASSGSGGDVNKSTSTSEKSFAMEVEGKDSERPQVMRAKSTRPTVPRGYSVSQRIVEDGTKKTHLRRMWQLVTEGGTIFDGFLLAASQEVGQSILSLPMVFAQLGFAGGIILEFFFATLALYTCVLLVTMHAQFRQDLKTSDDPRHHDEYYIVSYYEIMEHYVGKWLKYFSMAVVLFSLIGLSAVQMVAGGSNMYLVNDVFSKRTWTIILGCCFSSIAFVPTFRHFRLLSVLGIATTTYVAWYMTITSAVTGPSEDTTHSAPSDFSQFMLGVVSLLFTYGGHTSNIEVADVMNNPATYDRSYFWSYIYVFTLTMPNAVATYWAYGDLCLYNANAFALYPKTPARDAGMILLMLHEYVAFGLFAGPLFHMWEKLIRISHKPFLFRAVLRLPVCGFMLFLATAFPFFGAINAILGAFTTSFGTYIIPAFAFNFAFPMNKEDGMTKAPYFSLRLMRAINWLVVIVITGLGVGYGGYVSIKNFIAQFDQYELFAECYQCDTYGKAGTPAVSEEIEGANEGRWL